MYKNFVFDLDGTILDTIAGIRDAVNESLRACGYDYSFDREGTKALIGDGARTCIRRALKDKGNDPIAFEAMQKEYMPTYAKHQLTGTYPFPGLNDVLLQMKEAGARLFVMTNKPDALAKVIVPKHYGADLFTEVLGPKEGDPVKPDPTLLLRLMDRYEMKKEDTLYVGDSHVDIETGHNADLEVCLVTWGYDRYEESLASRAEYVISSVEELHHFI